VAFASSATKRIDRLDGGAGVEVAGALGVVAAGALGVVAAVGEALGGAVAGAVCEEAGEVAGDREPVGCGWTCEQAATRTRNATHQPFMPLTTHRRVM
jgi:hypothetical protein